MEKKKKTLINLKTGEKMIPVPKLFRRVMRARKNRDAERRNDGKAKHSGGFSMGLSFKASPMYSPPKSKKLKGWMKINKKSSFNRRRKAA